MQLVQAGIIRTPYETNAPFRPDKDAGETFSIEVEARYRDAMQGLKAGQRIIVYFYFDRSEKTNLIVHPPHLNEGVTGLFNSRSPNRINKIGMDIVKILRIEENVVYTTPMDILNGTPLLDIKPYILDLDCHPEG